uniref:Basic leucine zipper and W2 domains 1a n=1 Tax=Poecilia reticulata TaxID=8081 RepID=A0A3P9QF80_POERE
MLTGILLANGSISASILTSLYNENLVKEGVSAAFAVKLFKSWINEKDINSVAGSLRKVGMDNRLMELFPANKRSCEHFSKYFTDAGLKELSDFARNQQSIGARKELQKELQEMMSRGDPQKEKIVVLLYKADVLSEEAIMKWYSEAHLAKGKSVFLEQMKKFVEWLKNAEEESESDEEEAD